jgi:GntR family transcriptional repressor for pyruvate dehydrogenase complex
MAASQATPEQKVEILAQADEVERCIRDGESYIAADARFHRLIAEASGNRVFGNLTYILNTSIAKNIEGKIRSEDCLS